MMLIASPTPPMRWISGTKVAKDTGLWAARWSIRSFAMARGHRILGSNMSNNNSLSLPEVNDRIAVLRDNIRQLVEQAAVSSGAQNEERTSERLAQQQEELEKTPC